MPSGVFGVSNNSLGMNTEIRWWTDDEPWNNRSLVHAELWARRNSSTTFGTGNWTICISGVCGGSGNVSRSIGTGWTFIHSFAVWTPHNADGWQQTHISVSGGIPGTSWSSTSGGQTVTLTNYVVLPFAPYNLQIQPGSVTTTSFGVTYARNSYDAFDRPDQAQWAYDPAFTNIIVVDEFPQGLTDPATPINPGTTAYVRIRSHTSAGWGPWSATISQTTLPASAPGFGVSTSPTGTQAFLTFSPPGGVTGVSPYRWERRVFGTTTPVATGDSTITTQTVSGLTPGTIYEWRASAFIGSYQSPWTGWTVQAQPAPNTTPGAYYDGDTDDTTNLSYSWAGVASNSVSNANGFAPLGWAPFATAASVSGGTGVIMRASGGVAGSWAARAVFFSDATTAGFRLGGDTFAGYQAEAQPNETYYGSIYATPSRSQRMRARIIFLNVLGATVGSFVGAEQIVDPGANIRLVASGLAPTDTHAAIVVAEDVTGTGWSVWLGGEWLEADGMMITHGALTDYYDGDSPDTLQFTHEWDATPHSSPSLRLANLAPAVDLLADPECAPVPAPPMPPIIASACIDEIGTWRRYRVPVPGANVRRWSSTLPTLVLQTGSVAEHQVRVRVFANPDELLPDELVTDEWVAELIITHIPPYTKLTLDAVQQRAWAEVDGSEPIPANHLLYGTDGVPAVWPELRCGTAYLFALDTPLDAPAGNLTTRVLLTQRV